jgi:hypothetical protein
MLKLFISHSWDHDHHRDGMHGLIGSRWIRGLDWCDTSVPRDEPLHVSGGPPLRRALRDRIFGSDAVVVFAGIYSSYSDWIDFEVTTAAAQFKPIIGVRPRAQQNLSRVVLDDAWEIVGWNAESVTSAIIRNAAYSATKELITTLQNRAAVAAYLSRMGRARPTLPPPLVSGRIF